MTQAARRAAGALLLALALAGLLGGVGVEWTPVANFEYVVDDDRDLVDLDFEDGLCLTVEDTCTLRAAVMQANSLPPDDTATIRFAPAVETITLTREGAFDDASLTGDLDIVGDVTIVGSGTVIDGNGIDRIFDVVDASLRLERVILVGGLTSLSGGGGAIRSFGTLTLEHVQVGTAADPNVSGAPGGGGLSNLGHAEIRQSSFVGNSAADGDGGAIFNDTTGSVHLENVTIADNEATDGGGIYTQSDVSLFFVTLARNTATDGNGNSLTREAAGTFNVVNSIVTSAGPNCSDVFDPASNTNLVSEQVSGVWVGDDSCDTLDELSGLDPEFGLLERLDGTDVQTIAETSPAVDAGATEGCPATDQRGVVRPQGDACDLGAFEVEQEAAPTLVVTKVADTDVSCEPGDCSLREAINAANANADHDLIGFDIAGAGPHVIEPGSPLPPVTQPVTIDGYTQPGAVPNASARAFTGKLQVVLTGPALAWDGANPALALQASNSTVKGLLINGGFDSAISISGNGNVVAGNSIGTNQHCQITQDRSIVGQTESTILFGNVSGAPVNVYWLDYAGEEVFYTSLQNGESYVQPTWLTHPWVIRTLGGECVGYELSDSLEKSYEIQPPPPAEGIRAYGVQLTDGVFDNTVGGPAPADRNVISNNSGFAGAGVALDGALENEVAGNLIGTDVRGRSALPNDVGVLATDSSSNKIHHNVISGNTGDGVTVVDPAGGNHGRFNEIYANFVGTDAAGALDLGNGGDGIEIRGVGETFIGDTDEGDGNVVSGNFGHGIFLFDSTGALVEENFVGTDATGAVAIANGIDGIAVDGGADHLIRNNLASGNTNQGIAIFRVGTLVSPSGVTVQGNKAGTDASGTEAVPNGGHGILLGRANSTTVGGVGEGLGNRVAFNTGIGIAVATEGTANSVRGNSVDQNGGLGIDIVPEDGPNGLTANDPFDADTGPNNLQNFPVLTAVAPEDGGTVSVTAQLDTPASTNLYTIDYYATASCDGSDHGEGARHVGSHSVSISRDDVGPLPTFTSDGIGPLNEGEVLTATATDALNNTSEFSACFDPAAETTVTLALTADASVEAGARRVRYRDVPLSVFTRPPADEGQTESTPLDAIPLDAIPLDAIPLDAIPLDAIPLDAIGLSSALLNDALGGVPLTLVPLNPVRVPGGWDALLARTELAGRPAVTLTLSQVFALDPLPTKPDGTALSLADLDLASSPLGDLPLVALLLGPVELEDIPIGENGVADWCSAIDAEDGFACSDPSTLAGTSLMSVALRGLPLDAIPLDAIPLDAIPLDAIGVENLPLDAIPLDAILLKGTPLDAIPLDAILLKGTPLDAIPLDAIPLDAIGPGNVPLDAVPLDAIPLDAILLAGSPLDAIPLDAIPLDAIGLGTLPLDAITAANIPLDAIVSCGGSFDCDAAGATLRDAYLAGALQSGATLGDLRGALAGFELGDLRIAGNAVPPEVAQYTLGDLKEYGDLTLGELLAYGDVTLGEILEHVEGLTIGDLLLALLSPEAYPWEKLSYERLDPARYALEADRVAYSGAFAITSDSGPVGVTVRAQLPAGFSYVGGSSTLQFVTVPIEGPPVSGIQVIDDPEIEGQTLMFTFDSIARGTNYTVRVEARPTIEIGIGAASATAQPVGGEETAPDAAETSVTETFPDNDFPDEAPELSADSYYLSHVTSGEDIDYFSFPMPQAGSRVKVMLSHLDADFDLAVYGPDGEVPRDPDAAAAPLDAIPLADEELGLRQSTSALTPEALQDVPLLRDRALWGLSINRKTEDESVLIASSGESGDLTLQVSGYNRASSATPYMLRVQVLEPRVLPPCTPRELPAATAGTMPTLPTGLNTVFLVNEQRLRATYADAEQALTALQQNLAALNSLGFPSAVVPVEADAAVAQAYSDWDLQPCSPHKANAVVRSVTEVVDGIRAAHPTLKYVVLVGGDDIVPHARVDDATSYANEIQHAGTFPTNNQYLGAFGNFKLLTDNPYGATEAIPFFNRHLYVPELAVGRLVEEPAEIARAIEKFVEFEGSLAPETAFTTGYNFLGDGAGAIHGALEQLLGAGATSLISEDWTSGDILTALRSGTPPSIASINAHYDHHRSLPANENAAGTEDDLFTTADLRDPATPMLDRRLFFTMGCHAGLSLSDVVVGTTVPNGDWAQVLAEKGAAFAGNTGFGYGDTDTVGYTEQLLALFAQALPQAATIAEALIYAKQRYVGDLGVVGVYDEKVISQMTLYGLPMYAVGEGAPPAPPALPEPEADPVSGLQATSFSTGELVFTRQTGGNGQYDTVAGGDLQVTHLRPLQPRLHLPVRPGARGALITHLESEDSPDAFDPSLSRPIVDHSSREPELDFDDVAFPTKIQTITHGPATEASLVLIPGQFFTTDASEPGRGIQRRFTSIEGLVYGDGTGDGAAPELLRIDGAILGSQASFTVDVTDAEGGPMDVKRVLVLYKDGLEWRSADLTRSATAPSIWSGGGPVSGDQTSFFVQAVEEGGFVAVSTLKGRYYQAVPPAGAADWLTTTLTGTQGDDGWYLSAVGVDLQGPGGTLTVSVDGGPVQAYAGAFTVSGDGIHRVDVRAPDGRETSFAVPIDTSDPTVSITSPAAGELVVVGSTVDAVFACSDAGSGIASCTASSDPVDTTTAGPKTLTVTATDAAGNTTSAQRSYTVVNPDILFSSSRTGHGDIYALSSEVATAAPQQVTSGPAIDAEPDWFPGRQRIAFTRVVSGNVEIYAMNSDGTGLVRLTDNSAIDTSPAVSPNGQKIAFASNRGGNWDVYVMDAANGANVKRLTKDSKVDTLPAWRPDGLLLAFSSGRTGDGDIYTMKPDGASQTRVTSGSSAARLDTEPTWIGSKIAFSSNRSGSFDLYSTAAGGGAATRLTSAAGHDFTPSASSDGTRILFASNRPGGTLNFDLYTMNADGTNPTPLVVHPSIDAFPEW